MTAPILETDRLTLEPLSAAHAEPLYAIYRQPGVGRFLITRPTTRHEFERVFARALQFEASHGMWAIVDKASAAIVGRIGFFAFGETARPELAFLLAKSHWGRGLATEASRTCLWQAFERRAWEEVIALVRPENSAAIRVLDKLRLTPERTLTLATQPAILYQLSRSNYLSFV